VTTSRRIAGLLGPTLIALAVSEAINLRDMADHPAAVGLVYLNGTLLFVAGVAIVQVHNRWTRGWPVLVTVMGWFAILGGVMRMLAPQATTSGATWVYGLLVALLAVGVVLTVKGYSRRESEEGARGSGR
jgi:predicted phage tail protein